MTNPQILKNIGNSNNITIGLNNFQSLSNKNLQELKQQGNRPSLYFSNNERNLKEIFASNSINSMKNKNFSQKVETDLCTNEIKGDKKSLSSNNYLNNNIKKEEKKNKDFGEISNIKASLNLLPYKTERELILKNQSLFTNSRYNQFPTKFGPEGQPDFRMYQFDLNDPVFATYLQGANLYLNNEKRDEQQQSPNNNNNNIIFVNTGKNTPNNNNNANNANNSITVRSNLNNPYNNCHSSLYSHRHQLYYDFIETINFSNMMLYIIPIKFKPMQSYKYCVLRGNNHLLILRALKQRLIYFNIFLC